MVKSGKTKTGSVAPKLASNAPKATVEQINLAKLLTTGSDDTATEQFKLQQVMLACVNYSRLDSGMYCMYS